jgi:hypothetical protein
MRLDSHESLTEAWTKIEVWKILVQMHVLNVLELEQPMEEV